MNNIWFRQMIENLYTLNRLLFEPFTVSLLLGIGCLIWGWRHAEQAKVQMRYEFFLVGVFLLLGWRLFIHLSSSRYGAILLIPAILSAAAICRSKKIDSRVSHILLAGLTVVCIAKQLRFDSSRETKHRQMLAVKTDAATWPGAIIINATEEGQRYSYYSGLPTVDLLEGQEISKPSVDEILTLFNRYISLPAPTIYLVLKMPASREMIPANAIYSRNANWVRISAESTDRKKQFRIDIYRLHKMAEPPPAETSNLIMNGNFTETLPVEISAKLCREWFQKGIEYFNVPRLLPSEWVFDFCSQVPYAKMKDAELELLMRANLSPVLRMKSSEILQIYTKQLFSQKSLEHKILFFYAAATPGSLLRIRLYRYKGTQLQDHQLLAWLPVWSDGENPYTLPIAADELQLGYEYRIAIGIEQGELWLRNVWLLTPQNSTVSGRNSNPP